MPSGKTHDFITYALTLPILLAAAGPAANFYTSGYLQTSGGAPMSGQSETVARLLIAIVAGTGFLFGGLMFGPDLDVKSVQYYRWGYFRAVWIPYQKMFSHRSRFTHGYAYGPIIRIAYFSLVCAVLTLAGAVIHALAMSVAESGIAAAAQMFFSDLRHSFAVAFDFIVSGLQTFDWKNEDLNLAAYLAIMAYAGIWLGGASHSAADFIVSYLKHGKIEKFDKT